MKTYCLVSKKNTENKDPKVIKRKNGRLLLLSKCSVCGNQEARFTKQQKAKGILSSSGIRAPLSNISRLNISF